MLALETPTVSCCSTGTAYALICCERGSFDGYWIAVALATCPLVTVILTCTGPYCVSTTPPVYVFAVDAGLLTPELFVEVVAPFAEADEPAGADEPEVPPDPVVVVIA